MERKRKKYTYCIFYLEKKLWKKIPEQIEEAGYNTKLVKAVVPTVNVLRKTIKGKMIFEETPVLFNYGFIKMPTECAFSRPFLNRMKKKIPGIHSWLKDTLTLHPKKKRIRIDNAEDWDDFSIVASASRKDVRRFLKISRDNKKFSLDDLINHKPGDYVTLKGYPYEGVGATVKEVNYKDRTITVELLVLGGNTMPLTLPFDHVLYSVYLNYDPDVIQASFLEYDPNDITQESIDNIIDRKTY